MTSYRLIFVSLLTVSLAAGKSPGAVFINEIFINPPGTTDDTREFIELLGPPGMKLDGYAVVLLSGGLQKYYDLASIPPFPVERPEVDELFSLDGLSLGANGMLVLFIGNRINPNLYPQIVPGATDANVRDLWFNIWNGSSEDASNLQNDGSNTFMLIRNRPGITEADPANPAGSRWAKDARHDDEWLTPVEDSQDGVDKHQWGDGNLDKGEPLFQPQPSYEGNPNLRPGNTRDLKGAATPADVLDDLEIVDEVSYEHERGWEYDQDERRADVGSADPGLPQRRVHALDDPQGFNPDALTRVDYRTKGPGWVPALDAVGEGPGGNNWQDTATEQWVRGEAGAVGGPPVFYYDNFANTNPDSIQPYVVNVPLWLDDAAGGDYDFGSRFTYPIIPGRLNPLAVPFIPGDTDRDGDCDTDDIAKLLTVYGDGDWVFSNSYDDAPETDSGDPATQTRPWDVDLTGANGIEPSDLQWVLNFQGDTTGRIVGLRYEAASNAPDTTGIVLNENDGVECTVSSSLQQPTCVDPASLSVGQLVDVLVSAHVTSGANLMPGEQNGVMQFAHDLLVDVPDVLEVIDVDVLSPFSAARPSRTTLLDGGARLVNGYTTSFTNGLTGPVPLYRVTLKAVGSGSASLVVAPAAAENFLASTPFGVKIGHTLADGDPASASYPMAMQFHVQFASLGDCNADGAIDIIDAHCMADCLTGPTGHIAGGCGRVDLDGDCDVDLRDWSMQLPLISAE